MSTNATLLTPSFNDASVKQREPECQLVLDSEYQDPRKEADRMSGMMERSRRVVAARPGPRISIRHPPPELFSGPVSIPLKLWKCPSLLRNPVLKLR